MNDVYSADTAAIIILPLHFIQFIQLICDLLPNILIYYETIIPTGSACVF